MPGAGRNGIARSGARPRWLEGGGTATGFAARRSPEGFMRHDWILAVLSDLHAYALANGLVELALKVAETQALARREIALRQSDPDPADPDPADPDGFDPPKRGPGH
jgi:hypothetical protein